MVDERTEHETDEDDAAEPERMSWFVLSFMLMCLFMTAVMSYYAWGMFQRAV